MAKKKRSSEPTVTFWGGYAWHARLAQQRAQGQAPPPPALLPTSTSSSSASTLPVLPGPAPEASAPASAPVPPLGIHRVVHNQRGDSRLVRLDADEVYTWIEQQGGVSYCVVLLRGRALFQHGVLQARLQQGVAWIDMSRYKSLGELHVHLYAEGNVRIQESAPVEVPRAVIEVLTRGQLKVHSCQNKMTPASQANDPLVARARAEKLGPVVQQRTMPTPAIQPVGHQERSIIPDMSLPHSNLPPLTPPAPGMMPGPAPGSVPPPSYPPSSPGPPALPTPGSVPFGRPQAALDSSATLAELAQAPARAEQVVTRMAAPDEAGSVNVVAVAPGTTTQQGGDFGGTPPPTGTISPMPTPTPPPGGVSSSPGSGAAAGSEPIPGPGPLVPAPTPLPLPPPSKPTPPPPGKPLLLPTRRYIVAPRSSTGRFTARVLKMGDEQAIVITGGVILNVRNAPGIGFIDMEADRLVVWTRDLDAETVLGGMQKKEGHSSNKLEFYLAGHVVIRQAPANNPKNEERTIRADEAFYDVNRNVAIISKGEVQMKQPSMQEPIFFRAPEIEQLNATTFHFKQGEAFSSKLPSDPGLRVYISEATVEDKTRPLTSIFGQPQYDRKTGQPLIEHQTIMTSRNLLFQLEQVPVFYLPYSQIDLRDPLGPVQNFMFGFNRIFGPEVGVSLNAYELLGIQPLDGTRWLFNVDYLAYRGPGLGQTFDYNGFNPFGIDGRYTGIVKMFGMYDHNYDNLGGPRPFNTFRPNNFRGRFLWTNTLDALPYGFSSVSQVDAESDRNFLEQYFKREFDLNPDRITVGEVQQQQSNWVWSFLGQARTRPWVTETQWLPRADGWLVGQNLFNYLTYNGHANIAYASLQQSTDVTRQGGKAVDPITDQSDNTGRADWMQELNVPIQLGGLKVVPYAIGDLTGYTRDLAGNPIGRIWGGGGARASLPLTRIYPSVSSDLFNLNGINHKMVFTADYLFARTNVSHYQLPQLDRLNDATTQQAYRDAINADPILYATKPFLIQNPIYDPQIYAIRQMILWRTDTLDNINVLSAGLRQRWQTKRGYPGSQHIVDWMVLNTNLYYFPNPNGDFGLPYLKTHYPNLFFDNYGAPGNAPDFSHFQLLQYEYLWNIGDRTALTSTGWIDPFVNGPRVFTVGAYFNRPDRTNFYLGYRQIDPLNSRVATLSVTYVFSPKYAITGSVMYDFGNKVSLGNTLMFTRMGTDLQVSLGFNYNATQNNFGFLFNIIPNIVPANRAMGPIGSQMGTGMNALQ